jgi:VWFA-related protein
MGPTSKVAVLAPFLLISTFSQTQNLAQESQAPAPRLRVTSRAVVVDVVATDSSGNPVAGLTKDAFTITEQGKPQTISFFEEHGAPSVAKPEEMPELPPGTFSNFSPFPEPPAVNVILLDTLNTRVESQSGVHRQVLNFLQSAKPGTRSAIFALGLSLKFIQGFNDDPAVLVAALSNKKNLEVENPVLLKSQAESSAQERVAAMGAAGLAHLFKEMDSFNEDERKLITLGNLQRLAVFLQGFPGRKNVIWFAERPPGIFNPGGSTGDPAVEDEIKKTIAMLGEVRAALYPVDARGISVNAQYTAENNPAVLSTNGDALKSEGMERNTDQLNSQILAEDSGGRAFANTNGLSGVLDKVTSDSGHFYTLSYSPANVKMDGAFRKIEVKILGGRYKLLYRRGYYAIDAESPSSSLTERVMKLTGQVTGVADPLLPSMEFGMPQSQQILYRIQAVLDEPSEKKENHYRINFAVDLKDLNLDMGGDGVRRGTLNFSCVVYDRYGNVIAQQSRAAALSIKPKAYAAFQTNGVQLHTEISVPKGNYWLRTGVFDPTSRKVGTMEIPLIAFKPTETAAKQQPIREYSGKPSAAPSSRSVSHPQSEPISVEQLERLIEQLHQKSDKDAAQKLAGLRLSERLTPYRLDRLERSLPGERSRMAVLAIADVSAFLAPPSIDIDSGSAPDRDAEKQMLSRAVDFVLATTARMPNFLAKKKVVRLQNAIPALGTSFPVITPNRYHIIDSTVEEVRFRGGHEELGERGRKSPQQPRPGLVTTGVFGPMLQTVMHDILKGSVGWVRWDSSPSGPVAVFRYTVPKDQATFVVTWCCSFQAPGSDAQRELQLTPAYHGEVSIDPASGTIDRFTVVADLHSGEPIAIANVVVEYGPIQIAGRTYHCPIRSATLLVAKSFIVHHDFLEQFDLTSVSDTRFGEYHVFRSEMKILE